MNGVCAAESSFGYHCIRDEGHDGAHIATDVKNKILDTWCTPDEKKSA